MTSREATFSGLRDAVELKAMPTPTPSMKMAAKIAMAKGLSIEEKEVEDLSLGGAEYVSLGMDGLALRFIGAYINCRRIRQEVVATGPPFPSMPTDAPTCVIEATDAPICVIEADVKQNARAYC